VSERTAAIVVVGNEILSGKVEEKNAAYLSKELLSLGVTLRCIVVVPDEVPVIAEAVKRLAQEHPVVFTSGGVGPTHDDVTVEGVATAFKRPLVRNAAMEEALNDVYGGNANEHVLSMADIPEGTEIIMGPGLRVPVLRLENVYIFPGIPELFQNKFEAIRDQFRSEPFFLECVYTQLDESSIAQALEHITKECPDVGVGSYPAWDNPHYRVKVTLESKQEPQVQKALALLGELLPPNSTVDPPPNS